jgi:intracellular sulfur oxidation DsrE/DsrF family protein
MEDEPEIRERVYQLRRAKDLMRLGFGDARAPSSSTTEAKSRNWKFFSPRIAASVAALAVAFGAGMLSHHGGTHDLTSQPLASLSQQQSNNVILHISESDPQQFSTALAYAEKYLKEHQALGYQVDVVANAGGVDMMREDVSPLKQQMIEMLSKYDNVHFIACTNAIRALHRKGIKPEFLEGTYTEEPAMDYIIGRVQAGWTYTRVDSLSEI